MALGISKEKSLEGQIALLPKEVKFCKKCVISNQRPRIIFDEEGVCGACRFAYEKQQTIDWKARERSLEELLDKYRRKDGRWDVVVPGSGGKDSCYVSHQLKHRYGMHPLTVTWAPNKYTDIGYQNMQTFINSGFNNLLCQGNGRLNRKLVRLSFEEIAEPFQPFVYGQICYPFHIALQFDIKLIFYGENGEVEYGGDPKSKSMSHMPIDEWSRIFWKSSPIDRLIDYALKNKDYFTEEDFDESDLYFYRPPSVEALKKAGIQGHWYGYYHKWIPQEVYMYSSKHVGFRPNAERSEGTYTKHASLDDRLDGFHYYMAFIKFGIGRATSDAAHEIRDGGITREQGVELVRRYDGEFPEKYFQEFLEYTDITEEHFWEVVDSFRQDHIWRKINGEWELKQQVS